MNEWWGTGGDESGLKAINDERIKYDKKQKKIIFNNLFQVKEQSGDLGSEVFIEESKMIYSFDIKHKKIIFEGTAKVKKMSEFELLNKNDFIFRCEK